MRQAKLFRNHELHGLDQSYDETFLPRMALMTLSAKCRVIFLPRMTRIALRRQAKCCPETTNGTDLHGLDQNYDEIFFPLRTQRNTNAQSG